MHPAHRPAYRETASLTRTMPSQMENATMKLRKILIVASIVGLAGLLLYIVFTPPHYTWRQRLTVSVTTPQGLVEGSAVTQVDVYDLRNFSFGLPEASGANVSFSGEAVAVEIAPGRILFVLLVDEWQNGGPHDWPAYIWYKSRMTLEDYVARIKQQQDKEPEPLPQKHWPLMAAFDDISRPETLHIINDNDLSPWFGPGVQVEGLTLQITSEPMTSGRIDVLLPWLLPAGFERGAVAPDPTPFLSLAAFLSLDHWSKK